MELVDLTKQLANNLLPRRHQAAVALLTAGLLLLLVVEERQPNPVNHSIFSTTAAPPTNTSAQPLAVAQDPRIFLDVASGDNLSILFNKVGLGAQNVLAITSSAADTEALTDLHPGDRLAFEIGADNALQSFEVIKSPLESFTFKLNVADEYDYAHILREPVVERVYKEAVITDSLFLAAQGSNIPDRFAMDLAGIFGGVIDFIMDTREGDTFTLLYEEKFLDGEFIDYGRILAAQFTNQGTTHTAVRYENNDGKSDFYNPEGESMRKAFELNPVDFTRISSGFSLSRRHPILNTIRAHKGTDYAAPKGTEVIATADGTVTFVGRSGSFGKLIVIQHGERFITKYAHLNDYANGIKKGSRVRQRDIIGYVGTTGSATGPHLHYEFLMDGTHRNSRTIFDQLPRAESIAAGEMQRFRQQTSVFIALLTDKGRAPTALAQNSSGNLQE